MRLASLPPVLGQDCKASCTGCCGPTHAQPRYNAGSKGRKECGAGGAREGGGGAPCGAGSLPVSILFLDQVTSLWTKSTLVHPPKALQVLTLAPPHPHTGTTTKHCHRPPAPGQPGRTHRPLYHGHVSALAPGPQAVPPLRPTKSRPTHPPSRPLRHAPPPPLPPPPPPQHDAAAAPGDSAAHSSSESYTSTDSATPPRPAQPAPKPKPPRYVDVCMVYEVSPPLSHPPTYYTRRP